MRYFFSSAGDYLGGYDAGAIGSVPPGAQEVGSPPNHGYDKLIGGVIVPYVQPWVTTDYLARGYDSGNQTITAAGSLTLAHGLGFVPKIRVYILKCVTADVGYAIGDEIDINVQIPSGNASAGLSAIVTSTNFLIRFGSSAQTFAVPNKGTGASQNITNTRWVLIVRAYA